MKNVNTLMMIQDILLKIDRMIEQGDALVVTPEYLSNYAGYSRAHFSRLFLWATEASVAHYIRKRCLQYAAAAITHQENLIHIALRYGFETHSGFSKAFRREFGCSPEQYRRHGVYLLPQRPNRQHILNYRMNITGGNNMKPTMIAKPNIKIAGYICHTSLKNKKNAAEIPAFWGEYMASGKMNHLHSQDFIKNHAEYGACFLLEEGSEDLDYIIGVEVNDNANIPDEFDIRELPATTYAVFETPPSERNDFPAAIQGTWSYIMNDWFPTSGYEYASGCTDFELYDERCMGDKDLVCSIYIPVIQQG